MNPKDAVWQVWQLDGCGSHYNYDVTQHITDLQHDLWELATEVQNLYLISYIKNSDLNKLVINIY
jgi:hypothetical protein